MKLNKILVLGAGAVFALGAGIAVASTTNAAKVANAGTTITTVAATDLGTKATMSNVYNANQLYGSGDVKWVIRGGHNNSGSSAWGYMRFGGKLSAGNIQDCWLANHEVLGGVTDTVTVDCSTAKNFSTTAYPKEWGLEVYSAASVTDSTPFIAFSEDNLIDKFSFTASASSDFTGGTLTFKVGKGTNTTLTEWPSDAYFKVYFTMSDTTAANGVINLNSVVWTKSTTTSDLFNTTINASTVTGIGTKYATSVLEWAQDGATFNGKGIRNPSILSGGVGFYNSADNLGYICNTTALPKELHAIELDTYNSNGTAAIPTNLKISVGTAADALNAVAEWDAEKNLTAEDGVVSVEDNRIVIDLSASAYTFMKIERNGTTGGVNVKRLILEYKDSWTTALANSSVAASTACALGMDADNWAALKTTYSSWTNDQQAYIKAADVSSPLTEIERWTARYDYCVAKYGYEDFTGRGLGGGGGAYSFNNIVENNNTMIVGIAVMTAGVLGAAGLLMLRKKHQK